MQMTAVTYAYLAVAVLVMVHLFAGKLQILRAIPRSRWLSGGSGVSVAYVWIHLLPELEKHQQVLMHAGGEQLAFLKHHAYLVGLAGLVAFYGIEREVKRSRHEGEGGHDRPSAGIFWISTGAFAVYNAIIGYLTFHNPEREGVSLIFFTLAMAVHFLVNDFGLAQDHRHLYTSVGRWVLTAAIVAGAIVGASITVPDVALAFLVAFLSGAIIMNVLKEELPEERKSRFGAFAAGAIGYAALLVFFV